MAAMPQRSVSHPCIAIDLPTFLYAHAAHRGIRKKFAHCKFLGRGSQAPVLLPLSREFHSEVAGTYVAA